MVLSTNCHWAMEEGAPPCDRHRSWGSDRVTQLVGDTSGAAGPLVVLHLLHTWPHWDDLEQMLSSSLTGLVATSAKPQLDAGPRAAFSEEGPFSVLSPE